MKILSVTALAIPEIKVIRFARFADHRGYFAESFRRTDLDSHPETTFLARIPFVQMNESFSLPGVVRGLHFQWRPSMGKLVRTVHGRMVDIVLDIRVGSPSLGQALMHDMPAEPQANWSEWIWVPPGFAHGNFFSAETRIEYLCTGDYNPECEAAIRPTAPDIDWTRCDAGLKAEFDSLIADGHARLSDKDRAGMAVRTWLADSRSTNFQYQTRTDGAEQT